MSETIPAPTAADMERDAAADYREWYTATGDNAGRAVASYIRLYAAERAAREKAEAELAEDREEPAETKLRGRPVTCNGCCVFVPAKEAYYKGDAYYCADCAGQLLLAMDGVANGTA